MKVSLNEILQTDGVRTIDLSKLYRFQEAEQPHRRVRLAATRPSPSTAAARLQKLLIGKANTALVIQKRFSFIRAQPAAVEERHDGTAKPDFKLKPLQPEMYSVLSDAGKDGRSEIHLPFGMPRFVNARTLKAMLGAKPWDRLFRKTGTGWNICPDSLQIDITDSSKVFRLGKIQVLS